MEIYDYNIYVFHKHHHKEHYYHLTRQKIDNARSLVRYSGKCSLFKNDNFVEMELLETVRCNLYDARYVFNQYIDCDEYALNDKKSIKRPLLIAEYYKEYNKYRGSHFGNLARSYF